MSNIQDNTIFSPSVFSPGLLGRTGAFQTYLLDKRNGTGVLDQNPGASAAYSLYDLGNRRGSVVETEATYHNPAVRLRRDSDNTHKSFPAGAFTQMQNWANEDVEIIGLGNRNGGFENALGTWNVSAGVSHDTVDFYSGAGSAKMTVTAGGFEQLNQAILVEGNSYSVTFWAKISDVSKTFRADFGSGNPNIITPTTTNWEQHTVSGVCSGDSQFRLARGTSSGDYTVNFDNVVLTQLTSNAYATTWYDQSGSDNDATQTTADNQPKVVASGSLVTDANGNASLSFDGVDDELVVANLVNEFENTDFQVTIMALNFYGGLVSGSVPRLYLRDTAYSYDDLSLISYSNPSLALQTFECAGSAHEVFHDGASVGTGTKAQTAFGPTDFAIGQSAAAYRNTTISAFVFYPSDQSANRSAIEQSLSNTLTTALS